MTIASRLKKKISGRAGLRAAISLVVFLILWEAGARSKQWLGFSLPWIGMIPAPTAVLRVWGGLLNDRGYWQSWYLSLFRVLAGFIAAMVVGIPLGLLMAVSKNFNSISFPTFEILRPIPPLAWVPVAIIFWPTQELSIAFVTFLGAFFTVVINVVGGARAIDVRYFQSAQAMGSSQWDIFRRIVLPATLPSIVVGSSVGMGITWNVVVAAEMISGGGSQTGGSGGGLGFFIWNSYVGGSYEQIVVGMLSIGIAGYACSELLRSLGGYLTPWLKKR
ncbi:ABC transporter permease [Glaciimonas immobilis]|uniref:NitT/TauT family transport system permease protein n=1 Tax=Glaciimonas immobilis TaxID=728004 RepID=A0A840RW67_9BURK|nr:ABC transporter permease [Glaciimonas immobilis]KAF3996520.1 ABC transporter permease [Glaciimonas immobilis]MBB5201116.1 NitT/TauT family transport system permease protein [Glaciimonas immobilis]